jgi:hypothetical protein
MTKIRTGAKSIGDASRVCSFHRDQRAHKAKLREIQAKQEFGAKKPMLAVQGENG